MVYILDNPPSGQDETIGRIVPPEAKGVCLFQSTVKKLC